MVFIIQSIRLKENCKILRIKNVSYKLKNENYERMIRTIQNNRIAVIYVK